MKPEKNDISYNRHRKGKSQFVAWLVPEEQVLIEKAKERLSEPTDRGLIVRLCELDSHAPQDPKA